MRFTESRHGRTITVEGSARSWSVLWAFRGLTLLTVLIVACDSATVPEAPLVAEPRTLSTQNDDDSDSEGEGDALHGAVLFVGNLAPAANTTNGILRYDSTGAFMDLFTPGNCCMAFGRDENLYVTRMGIQRHNGVTGAFISTFIAPDPTGRMIPFIPLLGPDRMLYISDRGVGRAIRRYDVATGAQDPGFFIDGAARGLAMGDPQFYAFGRDDNIYVTSLATHRVLRFSGVDGAYIDDFVSEREGGLEAPSGIAFDKRGIMYVGSTTTDRVLRFNRRGEYIGDFFPAGSGGLDNPVGLTFGPDRDLYVASASPAGSPAFNAVLRYDGKTGDFRGAFVGPNETHATGPRALLFKSKIRLCHVSPRNPEKARTIRVRYLNAPDHLAHGDAVGPCAE